MKLYLIVDNNPKNIGSYTVLKNKTVSRTHPIGTVRNVQVKDGKVIAVIDFNPQEKPASLKISTRVFNL